MQILNQNIDKGSKIVGRLERINDREEDTVVDKDKQYILTHVDCKSRLLFDDERGTVELTKKDV